MKSPGCYIFEGTEPHDQRSEVWVHQHLAKPLWASQPPLAQQLFSLLYKTGYCVSLPVARLKTFLMHLICSNHGHFFTITIVI